MGILGQGPQNPYSEEESVCGGGGVILQNQDKLRQVLFDWEVVRWVYTGYILVCK